MPTTDPAKMTKDFGLPYPAQEIEEMAADVYFNLQRLVWSIKDRQSGRVAAHATCVVFLLPVTFVANPAGRARVIETGHKNVHAYVRGPSPYVFDEHTPAGWYGTAEDAGMVRVTYNPKKAPTFFRLDNKEPINSAIACAMLAHDGVPVVWALSPTWTKPKER